MQNNWVTEIGRMFVEDWNKRLSKQGGIMARTASLPGVGEEIPELTKLAEKYIEKRDERMAVGKKESELKQQLIAMMKTLHRRTYFDEEANLSITLESQTKIKVKIGSDEEEDE